MLSQINLNHLKYFYDAVLLRSISAAARENFVSQSAISQGISKLEQALQITLSTHQRQSFYPTEAGQIVFNESQRIFEAIRQLKERLNDLHGEVTGEVHFACTNAIAQYLLPAVYLKMQEYFPRVQLKFHRGNINFIHSAIKQKQASFALALDGQEFEGYEKEILAKGYFRLFKAKGVQENREIFIDHRESREVIELTRLYKEHYHKSLIIREALSGWSMVAMFVLKGCGLGFLPEFIFAENNLVEEVELGLPLIPYTICAFNSKGSEFTRAEKIFLENLYFILQSQLNFQTNFYTFRR